MRRFLLIVGLVVFLGLPVEAQRRLPAARDYPLAEWFGGYSYANVDASVKRQNAHGWATGLAGNVHRNIGLVGDFAGHYGNLDVGPFDFDFSVYQILVGPRVTHRAEGASIFFHTLFGIVHSRTPGAARTFGGARIPFSGGSETDFAMGIGGGVDANVSKNIAVRVLQVDYIPVRTEPSYTHTMRVQFGVVVKFGND